MRKFMITFIFVLALLIPASGCYAKGPWKGKVIDAETKQPIEGAAVVAVWRKSYAGPAGDTTRYFNEKETLTDKNGEFEIPSFWAVSVPFIRDITGPTFIIFKPGYGSFPWHHSSPKGDISKIFLGEGTIVEIPKLINADERKQSVSSAYPDPDAPWEKTPNLLKLINQEYRELGLEPIRPDGRNK